jgi:hypothetical protein
VGWSSALTILFSFFLLPMFMDLGNGGIIRVAVRATSSVRRIWISIAVMTVLVAAALVSPTASSAQTVVAPRPVFMDAFATGFAYNQWNGTNNVANTSPVHGGTTSISTSIGNLTGIFISVANGESLNSYGSLRFWIHGGVTGITGAFVAAQGSGANATNFPLPAVAANTWVQVSKLWKWR